MNDADSDIITKEQLNKQASNESLPIELTLLNSIDSIGEKAKKRKKKEPELSNKERVARQQYLMK